MEKTPTEWLQLLTKRYDDQAPRLQLLTDYAEGRPPLPEASKDSTENWLKFQRRSVTPIAGNISKARVDKIHVTGVHLSAENPDVEKLIARIMRDTRFQMHIKEAAWGAATCGVSYLMWARDTWGRPVITAEKAQDIAVSVDPTRPWEARAALKIWRDEDAGVDQGYLWDGSHRYHVTRPARSKNGATVTKATGGWTFDGEPMYVGRVPLAVFKFNAEGKSVFESVIPIIDAYHHAKLTRDQTFVMQAFRQRALQTTGKTQDQFGGVEAVDDGEDIVQQLSTAFTSSPDALWELPEGMILWESQQTDIRPMGDLLKDTLREIAALSRTPLSMLIPDGANQSAEGAQQAAAALDFDVSSMLTYCQHAVELALVKALEIEQPDALGDETLTVSFRKPQHSTETARMNAVAIALSAQIPWETAMREIGDFDAEVIARMKSERATEQALGALFTEVGGANGGADTGNQQAA